MDLGLNSTKDDVVKLPLLKRIFSSPQIKTLLVSGIAGVVIIIAFMQISDALGFPLLQNMGIVAGIMIAVVPLSIIQMKNNRKRESIDKNLPVFLLALISAVESGSSLLRAVEEAAGRKMGSLTPELQNLRANISWSMPQDEAFVNFTKRVHTKLARRVGTLLQIAMEIGGDVSGTLEMVQKHVTEMQAIEKERRSALSPYVYTIYIAFVVFLAVSVILTSQFFTEIEVVQNQLIESAEGSDIPLGMFGALLGVNVSEISTLMFHMSLVEAIFGGLAAGKISSGSFIAGIKHVVIMVVIAVIAFSVMGIATF